MVAVATSLVPVVEVPPWWMVFLPGASGGGASLVACVLGSFRAGGGIYTAGTMAGADGGASARRAVSLLNQSCRVRLIDAITLIINYLGAPFGYAFTKMFVG